MSGLGIFRLQLIRTTFVLTYVEFECRVEIVVLNDIYLSEVWVHVAVRVHHSDQRCLAALFPSAKTTWIHKSFHSIPIITVELHYSRKNGRRKSFYYIGFFYYFGFLCCSRKLTVWRRQGILEQCTLND